MPAEPAKGAAPPSGDVARRTDPVSLAGGIGLVGFGVLLLLDQTGAIALTFGWLGAIVSAVAGAVLLISGLRDPVAPRPPEAAPPVLARGASG